MTSPDGSIPTKALTYAQISAMQQYDPDIANAASNLDMWAGAEDARGALFTVFYSQLERIPIIGGGLSDLLEVISGVEDGNTADVGTFINLLLGRDVSLASRVSALENKIAVGAEFFDNFKRGDNESVLGSQRPTANEEGPAIAPWVQFGTGQPLGIHDQAAQQKRDALPADGVRYARCPFLATSNDYTISAVIHPKGTPNQPATSFYGRCNADGTEGVYVDFFGNRCRIGRFTRSGNAVTRTQWAINNSKSYSNSSTPQLRMIGNRYQVVIDDVVVIDYTDTSGFPVDAAHRTSMFSLQCWTAILQVPQWSGGLASFAVRAADLSAVQTAVSQSNTAITQAGNAEAAAGAVLGIAENADAKATAAQETANAAADAVQDALAGAQQTQFTWMVASAGVVLGRNEVNIGDVVTHPVSRQYHATSVTYGFESNPGGVTVQLLKVSPTRVATVVRTTTIDPGVVERLDDGFDVVIERGYRLACNVTSVTGTASVMLCTVGGALV